MSRRGKLPVRIGLIIGSVVLALSLPGEAVAAAAVGQPTQAAPAPAPAPIVQRINVVGTQRIEPDTIISYMTLQQGKPYTAAAGDESLKALFATGLFADVRLDWNGTVLTVQVVENPIVNQVAFEGNSSINTDTLTMEVQIKPRDVFTRARVQADVQRIIELYRRSGRFGATVDPKIIQRPQNRVDLIFEIHEGESTGVARINFIGNKAFSASELRGQIATTESAWWRFLATSDNYDPDRLTFDREQLRRFYLGQGYADFRVISAVAELSPDRSAFFITFTLEEGEQYNFGKIDIDSKIPDLKQDVLLALVTTKEGELYNAEEVNSTTELLTLEAGTQGFAFTDIRPRIGRNRDTHTIDVTYLIDPALRVYVDRVNIVGNTRTRDNVIRREMRLTEGDAYNRVLEDRSRARILALGFFKSVDITREPGEVSDRSVLTVTVVEQPTGELSLGAGFSSADSFLAQFSYTERNLFGKGQFLRAAISASSLQQQLDLRFTDPYFMDLPLAAGVELNKLQTDFTDYAGYLSDTELLSFFFNFPISEFGRLTLSYSFSNQTIDAQPSAPAGIQLAEGSFITSAIGYAYTYDYRDDTIKPNRGGYFSLSQGLAGIGGELKYLRTEARGAYYHPLFYGFVGSAQIDAGYIGGLAGQEVRLSDRFFKGGDSFRGFEIAGIGPRDLLGQGNPALGGQLYYIGTLAARLPPFLPESYGIDLSLFTDIGSLGLLSKSVKKTGGTQVVDDLALRASAGLSVSWKSPFGPVQIDFGVPFLKQDYDKSQAIRFSTATRF